MLQLDRIVRRGREILLRAEIAGCRLTRGMAEQHPDLFELSARGRRNFAVVCSFANFFGSCTFGNIGGHMGISVCVQNSKVCAAPLTLFVFNRNQPARKTVTHSCSFEGPEYWFASSRPSFFTLKPYQMKSPLRLNRSVPPHRFRMIASRTIAFWE